MRNSLDAGRGQGSPPTATHKALLEAIERVCRCEGVPTITAVAREAGVTPALIHNRYPDVAALRLRVERLPKSCGLSGASIPASLILCCWRWSSRTVMESPSAMPTTKHRGRPSKAGSRRARSHEQVGRTPAVREVPSRRNVFGVGGGRRPIALASL